MAMHYCQIPDKLMRTPAARLAPKRILPGGGRVGVMERSLRQRLVLPGHGQRYELKTRKEGLTKTVAGLHLGWPEINMPDRKSMPRPRCSGSAPRVSELARQIEQHFWHTTIQLVQQMFFYRNSFD
jgi:hypothetical protein